MSTGWIKVHRSLLDWEWYDDMNTKCLYIHCLLRANHSDTKWRGFDIKRGQFITSLESLSKETGLSISQIRTSIKKLISTGSLASKSQAKSRILTVLEYDSYQGDDKQASKLVTSKSQGSDRVVTTDKNVIIKECNKKDLSVITDGFDHWWTLYPTKRRKNKTGCFDKFKRKCKKLSDDEIVGLVNKISVDIKKRVDEAEDVKFIPMTEPYLNQERWMDGE